MKIRDMLKSFFSSFKEEEIVSDEELLKKAGIEEISDKRASKILINKEEVEVQRKKSDKFYTWDEAKKEIDEVVKNEKRRNSAKEKIDENPYR